MNIYVCVGSSCHLKGSYDVIKLIKNALATHHLEDKVNLSTAFCLGKCKDGVSVKIDDEIVCGVTPENFEDFFNQYIQNTLLSTHSNVSIIGI